MPLSDDVRDKLTRVSVATLTTCLFQRGLRNACIQGVHKINPAAPRLVGEACTLRYIPAREDLDHLGVFEDQDHPQRRAVEQIRPGQVMVIDSRKDHAAASAGDILVKRMMKRGAAGVVTDGGLRDTPEIAKLDFPCYHAAASAPTNLTRHHAADVNAPIGCGDVAVYPGDVIVGDNEGVVVIPAHLAAEVADDAIAKTEYENFVEAQVMAGASTFGLYPPKGDALDRFAAWKAKRNG